MMYEHSSKMLPHSDPLWVEHGYGTRFQGFQNLMRFRIRDVLLVSSLYDLYVFEEDGRLYELIREQYQHLNLSHAPELTRVSNGEEAIALARQERRFDLIITTLHIEDMSLTHFAQRLKQSDLDIPVVLLAFDNRELVDLMTHGGVEDFDQIFIWHGDFRLLLAVIKNLEDKMNLEHDTNLVGVQSILVVEDDVRFYSATLPVMYVEVMKQAQRLISEGINLSHKQLRARARPKIILCTDYEEATDYYDAYYETVLGIISDIEFPRNGKMNSQAGLTFSHYVKQARPEIPILLQSYSRDNQEKALRVGAEFLLKNSEQFYERLHKFMFDHFYFGDFIFRTHDGTEVDRASDLPMLEQKLKTVPEESIIYHAERNYFSNWLKARTEFWLAHQLRPRKISDYNTIEETRQSLIKALRDYRKLRQRGIVTVFKKDMYDPVSSISRLGGGSLGGKARGLSFVNILINNYNLQNRFPEIRIFIPPAIVIGTDIFDAFVEQNELLPFALESNDDQEIIQRFLHAKKFPENILGELASFLDIIQEPLAVRSSSLLEDSHNQPFAGVYDTCMLPNTHEDSMIRLAQLLKAIKRVYASTYLKAAKDYIKATSYSLENEKMAVIVQKMVGSFYSDRFYPNFSGVARSYNYYPVKPQNASDGIVSIALGLGKMVVEGGSVVRFCPKYPNYLNTLGNTKNVLQNAQTSFYALDVSSRDERPDTVWDSFLKKYNLDAAEKDNTLAQVGSTFSPENDRIYDGISRPGARIVSFAPLIKGKLFPLPEITELLLDMGSWSMGTPVEIEFAVNTHTPDSQPNEFAILQMRPVVQNRELEVLDIGHFDKKELICKSVKVLGNGVLRNIYDIIVVDRDAFDRSKTREVAAEIGRLNSKLLDEKRPCVLIGMGRWGSLDPWLGIPVRWDQIAGARVIIETNFQDHSVSPSQGSHFFQNLNSFMVGYYTVHPEQTESFVDWDWLLQQKPLEQKQYIRHLRFEHPVVVKMNGHKSKGIVLKPEAEFGKT
ncbi:MAG: PEP/pyruvate-binding domain-containing protein [candidate division KSB1 bacterium]|nr:PEP/pyruvate-binding domain-containing protein [candidate division KSB1 bacterium]